MDLIALGPRRLRDIARPVDMFQVCAPGLRTEFPPLKTVDPTPGNLRPTTTSFIGREADVAEVQTALKAHRLVTLTGVGGVGKTRLAFEVASRSMKDYRGRRLGDRTCASGRSRCGTRSRRGRHGYHPAARAQHGREHRSGTRRTLEVIGVRQLRAILLQPADMIETIFAHSSTVAVLATSREGLRLSDEQLWPVPSLDVRAGAESAAATLFIERAQAVSPGVSLTVPDEAAVAVEICHQLDGIPLAIELAASRMMSMTVTEVRDRLGDRFRLLVGSRRGLERHQTLRHAVQWSYDLLDNHEKGLMARCSVFAGGFDLAAACAVTASDDELGTWISWMLWSANRSSSPTGLPAGQDSRCWRPSANSPKNN